MKKFLSFALVLVILVACKDGAQESSRPLIAVPQSPVAEETVGAIQKEGADAIIVQELTDVNALSEQAASWDGAAIPDGWVNESSSFSVLFYSAVAERNIPHTGKSSLSGAIDEGLKHRDASLSDIKALCCKAKTFKHAKELMDSTLCIDAHGDLPDLYSDGYALGVDSCNQITLKKMEEGHLSSCVLISYLGQKGLDDASHRSAFAYCEAMIDKIFADIDKNKASCAFARSYDDAVRIKSEGKRAIFIGVENGYGIGNDINNVQHFADRGVVYITLSHMYDNAICHSSTHSADTTLGLTPFGLEVVREMNRCGIIVDASHTSSGTFWDCIKYSTAPIICSHSGAKALFKHDRNLSDDQLVALKEKGGLVMVYLVPDYMGEDMSKVSIDETMDHLLHCIKVAGIDHVGISCDFDGGGGGWDLNGDNDVINITVRLLEAGLSDDDIRAVWSRNFFRVLTEVQRQAAR